MASPFSLYAEASFVGFKELQDRIATLSKIEQSQTLRKAVRDSQKLMQQATKQNAKGMIGGDMGTKISQNILVRKFKKKVKGNVGFSCMIAPLDNPQGWFIHETEDREKIRYWIPAAIEYGHVLAPWGNSPRLKLRINAKDYKRMSRESKSHMGMQFVKPIPFMRNASETTRESRFKLFAHMLNKYIIDLWTKKVIASKPEGYYDSDSD